MITVTVTPDEIELAAFHAITRKMSHYRGRSHDRSQNELSNWDNDIHGCIAELAWCKYRGIYWSGVSEMRARDGGTVDIRWTKHLGTGGVIVYDSDPEEGTVVLSDGFAPRINFIGWSIFRNARSVAKQVGSLLIAPRSELTAFGAKNTGDINAQD